MNDLEQYLLSKSHRSVDKDELMTLGKKAAARYVSDDTPLTDAVSELSKEAGLTDEQTKRVVEYANNSTFMSLFREDYDQNIDFPLADFDKMSSEEPKEKEISTRAPPPRASHAEFLSLDDIFGESYEEEKTASEIWTSEDMNKYFDVRSRVKFASSDLKDFEAQFNQKFDALRVQMSDLVKAGSDASEVLAMIKEAGVNFHTTELLIRDDDLYKTASSSDFMFKIVNEEHPLYKNAVNLNEAFETYCEKKAEVENLVSSDIRRAEDLKGLI